MGGKTVLSLVVLKECEEVADPADPFATESVEQYRVLRLLEGAYIQELWRAVAGKTLTLVARFSPRRKGAPLTYIPFTFFGAQGNESTVDDPVLYNLALVNLAHYRNTADFEHGVHFTGLPTAVISGVAATDTIYRIGSATAWIFGDPNAKRPTRSSRARASGCFGTRSSTRKRRWPPSAPVCSPPRRRPPKPPNPLPTSASARPAPSPHWSTRSAAA